MFAHIDSIFRSESCKIIVAHFLSFMKYVVCLKIIIINSMFVLDRP